MSDRCRRVPDIAIHGLVISMLPIDSDKTLNVTERTQQAINIPCRLTFTATMSFILMMNTNHMVLCLH
jgi:hypothetical protein